MKKLLFLLLLLPLGLLVSCNDDDDRMPSVDIAVQFENAVQADGGLYMVAGDSLTVKSVTVKSLTDKPAALAGVSYFLDHEFMGYNRVAPFGGSIHPGYLPVGKHLVTLAFDVLQVDKSIAFARVASVVTVVENADSLPSGTTPGTVVLNYSLNPTK